MITAQLVRGTFDNGVVEWVCTCGFSQQDPTNRALRCERCETDHSCTVEDNRAAPAAHPARIEAQ